MNKRLRPCESLATRQGRGVNQWNGRQVNFIMRDLPKPGRYAMFLRKSREDIEAERVGRFETLAKHESALKRLADDLGIHVIRTYRELASGAALADRDEAMAMLGDVRAGAFDGVLAFDLQRITRGDMLDQGTVTRIFASTGTLIVTPAKVYDLRDELDGNFSELEMLFGRMELARISKRMAAGKEEAVRQGQYIGSIAPYGWDKVTSGRMKTLAPNADNARMVSWYERIATGDSPRKIADEMNELGIPTPRGKTWCRSMIMNVIRNPINKGYVRWNQKRTETRLDDGLIRVKKRTKAEPIIVKGLHEGTVPDELWQRANDVMSSRASKNNGVHPLRNPLATLLVCKGCGRSMRCLKSPWGKGDYYVHNEVTRRTCWEVGAKVTDVVDLLIDALAGIAADIDVEGAPETRPSATPQLERDLQSEQKAAETLFRLVEKGMITDEEFARRRELSRSREEAIRARLAESIARDAADVDAKARSVNIRLAIDNLRNYEGRAQEVNDVLRSIIDRIEYEKDPETGKISLGVFMR